jgi:hypothetical protein
MSTENQNDALRAFLNVWNVTDENKRRELARRILSDDVTYIDVHTPDRVQGLEAFLNVPKRFREFAPDAEVSAVEPIQAHHNVGRAAFQINRGGQKFSSGLFVMLFDADGMIEEIRGFLD